VNSPHWSKSRDSKGIKRDFIARKAREEAAVLSPQAVHFAGAKWEEKASAFCVRNDGCVVAGERKKGTMNRAPTKCKYKKGKDGELFGGAEGKEVLGAFNGFLEAFQEEL